MPDIELTSAELERLLCGDEVNGGFVRDLCFTVWSLCHNPTNEDGNTDWGNDTLPTVQEGVKLIRGHIRSLARAGLEARKAEESMRERAALEAEGIGEAYGMDETGWTECSETVATAIRALPLTGASHDQARD